MKRTRTRGWRIGRIAGAPVILAPGSVVLAALLYVLFLPTFTQLLGPGTTTYLIAALLPLSLLASILLHEVAHGLSARAFRVPVTEYVLTLWGGHTAFDHGLNRPGPSAVVSVAGPAANALIAVAAWLPITAGRGSAADVVLAAVVYVNAILAGFNLLPGLPMDGGRLLEALVWRLSGNRALGTLVAARGGQVLALAVAAWGLWPLLTGAGVDTFRVVWSLLIAGVLWSGAQMEVRRAKAQRATAAVDLSALVHPVLVQPEDTTLAHWEAAGGPHHVTVVTSAGEPRGMVQGPAAASVPSHARAGTPLRAVSVPLPTEAVISTTHGTAAVSQVARAAQAGIGTMVVIDDDGGRARIVGVLSVEEVVQALGA